MKLLLDTHAFLWMSLDDPQLSGHAHDLMADTGDELFLSPASYGKSPSRSVWASTGSTNRWTNS